METPSDAGAAFGNRPTAHADSRDTATFDLMLERFKNDFPHRRTVINAHADKILKLLPRALDEQGVKYQDNISHRMKTLDSSLDSLRRRRKAREERSRLKARLETQGHDWKKYWERRDHIERVDDVGPFPSDTSLIYVLHDIGGIRILVYFPSHVDKVIDALKAMPELFVRRVVERGTNLAPDMYKLKKFVLELEGKPKSKHRKDDKIFAGYRATHALVYLREDNDLPKEGHVSLKEDSVVVEIQVTTVVMNAWSQVEHDIIYKADRAQGPSLQETRILDMFNGIVMVGENALMQLENIQQEREEKAFEKQNAFADSMYDIGTWIEAHCKSIRGQGIHGRDWKEWRYLTVLFDVLRALNKHTSGTMRKLIEELHEKDSKRDIWNRRLPKYLIKALHTGDERGLVPKSPRQYEREERRLLACRVAQAMRLAAYLENLDKFSLAMERSLEGLSLDERPSLVDFLNILHPSKCCVHAAAEDRLYNFCRRFLDKARLCKALQQDFLCTKELPLILAEMRLEAALSSRAEMEIAHADTSMESLALPPSSGSLREAPPSPPVLVPFELTRFLNDHDNVLDMIRPGLEGTSRGCFISVDGRDGRLPLWEFKTPGNARWRWTLQPAPLNQTYPSIPRVPEPRDERASFVRLLTSENTPSRPQVSSNQDDERAVSVDGVEYCSKWDKTREDGWYLLFEPRLSTARVVTRREEHRASSRFQRQQST